MELRHLRSFVAVARERNFSRAAEQLHLAQPPLSRQIQQLEEEVGAILLDRSVRPLRLTEAGRFLYEQSVQIMERLDEARAATRRIGQGWRSRFTIGFTPSTMYGKLPDVIRGYRARWPDTEVALVELITVEQSVALRERRIDVGVGRVFLNDASVNRRLLRNELLLGATPVGHPKLDRPGPMRLSELEGETLIVYPKSPRPSFADFILSMVRDHGVRPSHVNEVREFQTALGLVAAQAGVCIVPASLRYSRTGDVVYRPLDEVKAVAPVVMSSRLEDDGPHIQRFLDLVREIYERDGIAFGA